MSKYKTTMSNLISSIDARNFGRAAESLGGIKKHINASANYEIILRIISGDSYNEYNLYSANGFKSKLVTDMESLNACGVVSIPATLGGKQIQIVHMKTTLFNALLIIPGAEFIAEKMMQLSPTYEFNRIGTDYTQALSLVMSPEKGAKYTEIAKELVNRGGFKLDGFSLDKASGKKQTILEDLVASKNYELLSYMLESGKYNFNSEYEVFNFPALKNATPLMIFAYFGNFEGVKILAESGAADVNYIISGKKASKKLNALSFAGNNMDVAEYLIEKGCKFLGTTVGLTQSFLSSGMDFVDNMLNYHGNISKLLADRVYYQAATKLLSEIGRHEQSEVLKQVEDYKEDRKSAYKSFDTEKSTTQLEEVELNLEEVELNLEIAQLNGDDLETLLLKYIATGSEDIAEQIRTLCHNSREAALSLVSTLLADQYIQSTDASALIGNLLHDPRLIHNYFEQRKAITKAKMHSMDLKSKEEENGNWKTNEGFNISIKEAIQVKTSMSCSVYIKIADDLSGSVLGDAGLSNLRILSKNGLGKNGVKFRDDLGIITLKTKGLGNNRLVAEGIYKNESGDMLIYFKYLRTHEGVENWSKENHYLVDNIFIETDKINEDTKILGTDAEDID